MPEYDSPQELAKDLYDQAVESGDTFMDRLQLAVLSGKVANRKWRDLHE